MRNHNSVLKRLAQVIISSIITSAIIAVLVFVTQGREMPLLNPQGLIANQERGLILITFALSMVVVIPVLIMLFVIAYKYRSTNTKAKYDPDFHGHLGLEAVWWGVPVLIIIVLAIITGISTHALDPYKKIDSSVEPVEVQVVALEWKWLFIYPDKGVATLNYLNIPEDTPINFTITSDAPMNAMWIPSLAGQVYAMSGMSAKLHIMADTVGTYNGSSANISGEGFASMRFKVNSMTTTDFSDWVIKAAGSQNVLSSESYKKIAEPSLNDGEITYALGNTGLYNEVIMKYMGSGSSSHGAKKEESHNGSDMPGMDM